MLNHGLRCAGDGEGISTRVSLDEEADFPSSSKTLLGRRETPSKGVLGLNGGAGIGYDGVENG